MYGPYILSGGFAFCTQKGLAFLSRPPNERSFWCRGQRDSLMVFSWKEATIRCGRALLVWDGAKENSGFAW